MAPLPLTSVLSLDDRSRTRGFAPDERLRAHVDVYWTLSVDEPPARVRVIPDGRVDLVFDLDQSSAHLAGVAEAPFEATHARITHLLGVTLSPGAAAALLSIAIGDLPAHWQPLENVVGRVARELTSKLSSAHGTPERLALLDGFLLARLGQIDARVGRAIDEIEREAGRVDVAALGRKAGASARSLSRLFHHWVGIPPKRFARIIRAQTAIRRIADDRDTDLSQLALELGYADQAHMTREVREVAGAAPTMLAETFKNKTDSFKS